MRIGQLDRSRTQSCWRQLIRSRIVQPPPNHNQTDYADHCQTDERGRERQSPLFGRSGFVAGAVSPLIQSTGLSLGAETFGRYC